MLAVLSYSRVNHLPDRRLEKARKHLSLIQLQNLFGLTSIIKPLWKHSKES